MFRFENLEIWKEGILATKFLLQIANEIENRKLFRFAEQLRAAAMSITNNIAEGSGSFSDKEFSQFLNISRRSIFECVNILIILHLSELVKTKELNLQKDSLDKLSRMVTAFRKTLRA